MAAVAAAAATGVATGVATAVAVVAVATAGRCVLLNSLLFCLRRFSHSTQTPMCARVSRGIGTARRARRTTLQVVAHASSAAPPNRLTLKSQAVRTGTLVSSHSSIPPSSVKRRRCTIPAGTSRAARVVTAADTTLGMATVATAEAPGGATVAAKALGR